MTLDELQRAMNLAEELKNLRGALVVLKEDSKVRVYVKVEDLTRTYGTDRHRITFPYAKARLLDVMEAEERRLVSALADLGVSDTQEGGPR